MMASEPAGPTHLGMARATIVQNESDGRRGRRGSSAEGLTGARAAAPRSLEVILIWQRRPRHHWEGDFRDYQCGGGATAASGRYTGLGMKSP